MRIGVSSSGRAWVSMGPLGWLLYLVFVLPVVAVCAAVVLLIRLCVLICKVISEHRGASPR